MAYEKHKKGGQGGKLGLRNMAHWDYTADVKRSYKKTERQKVKKELHDMIIKQDFDITE